MGLLAHPREVILRNFLLTAQLFVSYLSYCCAFASASSYSYVLGVLYRFWARSSSPIFLFIKIIIDRLNKFYYPLGMTSYHTLFLNDGIFDSLLAIRMGRNN